MFEDKTIKIFSSRDKIREALIEYSQKYLDIQDIDLTKTSYMSYLINVLSILTSNLIYYNSATYREFFLIKAQQKESVLNLSAMLGYTPNFAIPASTQVIVQMPTEFTSSVTMTMRGITEPPDSNGNKEKVFKFYAQDTIFSVKNTVEIQTIVDEGILLSVTVKEKFPNGNIVNIPWKISSDRKNLYFPVNVVQSVEQTFEFVIPDLKPNQFFDKNIRFTGNLASISLETRPNDIIYERYIDQGQLKTKTTVDHGKEGWIRWDNTSNRNSIFLVNQGEKGYAFRVLEDGIKVYFGNGVIGTQPPKGHQCRVTITTTEGIRGNVISGSINRADRLYGVDKFGNDDTISTYPIKMTVINNIPATGGRDYPTIDEIREAAIVQVSTNKRLVTEYDFKNIKTIVEDLPINHAIPILKRSDIKRNEITLFTDILYKDAIVPTRNARISVSNPYDSTAPYYGEPVIEEVFDGTSYIDSTSYLDTRTIHVTAGDVVFRDEYTSRDFISMFDIYLDPRRRTCRYEYVLDEIDQTVIINSIGRTAEQDKTIIYPIGARFNVVWDIAEDTGETERHLEVLFIFRYVVQKLSIADSVEGWIQVGEGGERYEMTYIGPLPDSNGDTIGRDEPEYMTDNHGLVYKTPLRNIPQGYVDFQFNVNGGVIEFNGDSTDDLVTGVRYFVVNGNVNSYTTGDKFIATDSEVNAFPNTSSSTIVSEMNSLIRCQTFAVIRKDLSDYMYSQAVEVIGDTFYIYDVPVLLKEYWDMIINDGLRDDFILQVYNKLVTFDIVSYRMMTDFVNLKFSNTFGRLDNMRYNKTTIEPLNAVNPSETQVSDAEDGPEVVRFAVTDVADHPWLNLTNYPELETNSIIRDLPFLAIWDPYDTRWLFKPLNTNDTFEIEGNSENGEQYIFNGSAIFSVDKTIPLQILITVWIDKTFPETERTIVENIKNNLVEQMFYKTGYDKPIFRSQLTQIVQDTPGVDHCIVLRPEHDVFFNYNLYTDFTQEELLEYSPQLVQITKDAISVVTRNS